MAERIFKYELKVTDFNLVLMPEGASVLCVREQDGKPYVWAFIDDANPVKPHDFLTFGTGMELPKECRKLVYVGTYQVHKFVGHVFWRQQ